MGHISRRGESLKLGKNLKGPMPCVLVDEGDGTFRWKRKNKFTVNLLAGAITLGGGGILTRKKTGEGVRGHV